MLKNKAVDVKVNSFIPIGVSELEKRYPLCTADWINLPEKATEMLFYSPHTEENIKNNISD